jgi:hypothetical protein
MNQVNKNIALVGGKEIHLTGVVVYTGEFNEFDINKWYVSQEAIDLIE